MGRNRRADESGQAMLCALVEGSLQPSNFCPRQQLPQGASHRDANGGSFLGDSDCLVQGIETELGVLRISSLDLF